MHDFSNFEKIQDGRLIAILRYGLWTYVLPHISKTSIVRRLILGSRAIIMTMTYHLGQVTNLSEVEFFSKWPLFVKIIEKITILTAQCGPSHRAKTNKPRIFIL
jgi:hypothetical protein